MSIAHFRRTFHVVEFNRIAQKAAHARELRRVAKGFRAKGTEKSLANARRTEAEARKIEASIRSYANNVIAFNAAGV